MTEQNHLASIIEMVAALESVPATPALECIQTHALVPAMPALKNLTAKAITKAIRAVGIDAELLRGRDHWYYAGPAVEWAYTTTAGVYRLNHRNIEQWVEEAKRFAEDSVFRVPGTDIMRIL